jgi:lipopolysaccharide transport system permease protein
MAMIGAASRERGRGAAIPIGLFRIQPSRGWIGLNWRELWKHRELLYFLVWRDLKVRYKQTVLGAAWAIIQPLATMLVFTLFFGRLAKMPSDGLPYPLFCYTALVPWTLFVTGLGDSANSLVASSRLIKKVYFPRLIIPLATVLAKLVDFCLAFAVLVGMMVYYEIAPSLSWLGIPFFIMLALTVSLGTGLWLSALNVEFRDVRYVLPFIAQFWMLATPIGYPSSLVPEPWRTVYGVNAMVSVVDGFRSALLGAPAPSVLTVAVSSVTALAVLASGVFYFRRMEKTFADIV